MKYFRHESKDDVNIYPLVCWHVGAKQSDSEFINETVEQIANDPNGRFIYMGDGGECVTKESKGSVYEQTMAPIEQWKELLRLLEPIKAKGLFGIKGNHGERIFKQSGMKFDESLMLALGLPYLGAAGFGHIQAGRNVYSTYVHHGVDSGVGTVTKINAHRKLEQIVAADLLVSAHSHIAIDLPPRYMAVLAEQGHPNPVQYLTTHGVIAGSAYDSREGYAEDHGYPPIIPSRAVITLSASHNRRKSAMENRAAGVSTEIIRKQI